MGRLRVGWDCIVDAAGPGLFQAHCTSHAKRAQGAGPAIWCHTDCATGSSRPRPACAITA
jgi:hypothetical protein